MAHWEHRDESRWKDFKFNQPYAKGLKRLKEEVLAKTDFDPAQDHAKRFGFEVRFESTIPAGAETCHFTMWQASDEEREQWELLTEKLERKALRVVQEP
ncbi:MAG: hypothetical protein JRF42_14625 [Deltaproteobacteria bacterium]|nr:hypothetical protein [Deltaproteobacteria bacterium]